VNEHSGRKVLVVIPEPELPTQRQLDTTLRLAIVFGGDVVQPSSHFSQGNPLSAVMLLLNAFKLGVGNHLSTD